MKRLLIAAAGTLGVSLVLTGCYAHHERQDTGANHLTSVRAVGSTTSLYEGVAEFHTIRLNLPVAPENVLITQFEGHHTFVRATVVGATSSRVVRFEESLGYEVESGELILSTSETETICFFRGLDGRVYSEGLCIVEIAIGLPEGSDTQVFIKNRRLDVNRMTVEELILALSDLPWSFDTEKLDLISEFAQLARARGERMISISQLIQILKELAHDHNKLQTTELFSGLVSDPQNAHEIGAEFTSPSDQQEAMRLVAK